MTRKSKENSKKADLVKDGLIDESITDIAEEMANEVKMRLYLSDAEAEEITDTENMGITDELDNINDPTLYATEDSLELIKKFSDGDSDCSYESSESEDDIEEKLAYERSLATLIAESEQEERMTDVYFDSQLNQKQSHHYLRYRQSKDENKLVSKWHRLEKSLSHTAKKGYLELNVFKKPTVPTYPKIEAEVANSNLESSRKTKKSKG